ncbi:MAG TPA: NAD-dependent epimerase/dehydratase family protein [Gemmatimonadales bacterium]
MKILIFGGTGFIGPHLVREAVSRGHKVSIFSRGRHDGGGLPDGVERLIGDRLINDAILQGDLKALEGRRFDAVIDDPAQDPRWVRQSATLLKDSGSYMFVSSTGVFLPYLTPNNDETGPVLLTPTDGSAPQYGNNKAQCEKIVMETFGDHGQVVRPGYIVGPGDTTDRFSYWPQRFAAGGEMLVPGHKTDPCQFIDVRDLVAFMMKLVEERKGGIYNCTGPKDLAKPVNGRGAFAGADSVYLSSLYQANRFTFGEFVTQAYAALKSTAKLVWVDDYDFLRAHRITYGIPWILPEGENLHHLDINNHKAIAAGLKFRPLAETVRDTLADWPNRLKLWAETAKTNRAVVDTMSDTAAARRLKARSGPAPNFSWINPEKEAQVLADWKGRGH